MRTSLACLSTIKKQWMLVWACHHTKNAALLTDHICSSICLGSARHSSLFRFKLLTCYKSPNHTMWTLCITPLKSFNSYPLNSHFTWLLGAGFMVLISLWGSRSLGYSPILISFINLAQTMELNSVEHLKETSFQAAVTGDWCDSEQLSKTSPLFAHPKTCSCRGNRSSCISDLT